MMAFIEATMRKGASLPLHPLINDVLMYFNVTPFQFTPNFVCIMVAFYITFREVGIGEPSINEFAYVYGIKALAKHEGFWYITKWGTNVEGIWDRMITWASTKKSISFTTLSAWKVQDCM